MAPGRSSGVRAQILTLFRAGAVGALSDGPLLERFLARGDGSEAAFEVLVARHGRMVHSVCRGILGDTPDADDAFQATFLLLVVRAGSIRRGDALASWLFGTARRVAVRAKKQAAVRRVREALGPAEIARDDHAEPPDEIAAVVREEVARLPERYRAPVLLCELGGHSHAEAARQLQCPVGTVSGRLSRARDLLRERFARRGLAMSMTAAVFAAASSRPAPAALVATTARAGCALHARRLSPWVFSARADALARGVVRAGRVARLRFAVVVVLTAGVGVGGYEWGVSTPGDGPPQLADSPRQTAGTAGRPGGPRPPVVLGWHDDSVTSLAFAPDGKTLASGSRDATVRLWDLETLKEREPLRGHSAPVLGLAFSPDGGLLATADEDQNLKVWDVTTGRERVSFTWQPSGELPPADGVAAGPDTPESHGSGA